MYLFLVPLALVYLFVCFAMNILLKRTICLYLFDLLSNVCYFYLLLALIYTFCHGYFMAEYDAVCFPLTSWFMAGNADGDFVVLSSYLLTNASYVRTYVQHK